MSFRASIVFCIASLCLLSCSSKPTQQTTRNVVEAPIKIIEMAKDSDYFIDQAKQSHTKVNSEQQRNNYLLQAAEALQSEQKCPKSIKLLRVLEPELKDSRQRTQAKVALAECYLLLSNEGFGSVEGIIAKITDKYDYGPRIAAIEAQLQVNKKHWLKAAKAFQATDIEELKKSQVTWQWIKKLTLNELEKARLSEPTLQPWLQLAIIIKRFALQPELFNNQVVNWQSRNQGHVLAVNLPEEVQRSLVQAPIQAKRIAVLLPLTGRLANQGLAIKEGILAAYLENLAAAQIEQDNQLNVEKLQKQPNLTPLANQNNTQQYREIRFFDSALKTAQQLNTLVADFDVIIGPLVKQQIIDLTAILPVDKILLALNRIDLNTTPSFLQQLKNTEESDVAKPEYYYFSLAPEDEAQQLALHIQQSQMVRPIVFAADNTTTQRMAEAFISKWQETPNANQPDLTIFTDNKDMRTRVSEMLDVNQSKQRIKQMELMSDVEVFGVERNRRDIDAIVLFATPEQTKLLNPIIEASLSPFARKSLSVFASSRSYSLDLNSNSLRDLRNLTFTDMPWMLPDHPWQSLANQTTQLWPERQDTLSRLFAMGFDAYNLLADLRQLKLLPQIVSQGLTGSVKVDEHGVLHRRLPLAQVTQDRVKLLAMD